MKTVKEVALENRVRELERENYILRHDFALFNPSTRITSSLQDMKEMQVGVHAKQLFVGASWDVEWSADTGQVHVLGVARYGTSRFSYRYFMEDPSVIKPNGALGYLGLMHERVVKELAKMYEF